MRNDFSNRPGCAGKWEMSFPTAGPATKKGGQVILRISPGRHNRNKVFNPESGPARNIFFSFRPRPKFVFFTSGWAEKITIQAGPEKSDPCRPLLWSPFSVFMLCCKVGIVTYICLVLRYRFFPYIFCY